MIMEIEGIDNLFEEELDLTKSSDSDTQPDNDTFGSDPFSEEPIITNTPDDNILDALLQAKGISNSIVKIIDENEEEKEVNFYDLSREEQLEILNTSEPNTSDELDDSEIDLLNHLRTNNLSVEDFLTQYRAQILAEVQQSAEPSYDIDAYDDHELFLLDLKNKFDLTDEELQEELEKELGNEERFKKKVTKLREEYKQLEDQYNASVQAEAEAQKEEQYNQFANQMVTIATGIENFHGVYLEDSEKNETLNYLLGLDESGVSQFSKDLNDPVKLYEAAWYLRYGAEAFKALENAYEAEITRLKKIDKPSVVVRNSGKKPQTIDELY